MSAQQIDIIYPIVSHSLSTNSPLVGFELLLAFHDAKKQRGRIYNDWLAYKRKLADIEDQFSFLSAEIEDTGSIKENAEIMAGLVLDFGEITNAVIELEEELSEVEIKITEMSIRVKQG